MRTTLDLDKPVLDGLKRLQKREKGTLGAIASRLLSEALNQREDRRKGGVAIDLRWNATDMGEKIDIADKEALHRLLDGA